MKTNYSKFADNPLKYNFHTGLSGRGKNFSRMYDDDMSDPNVWQKLLHDNKYFSETKGYMRANIHEGLRTMANSAHSNLEKIGSDGMVDLSSHVVNLLENHPTFKVIPNPEQPNLHSNRNSPEYLYSPEYLPGGVYTDTRIAHISRFEDLLHGALNSEKLLSNKQRGVNHLGTEEHAQLREKARQMIRMRTVSRNI